MIIHLEETSLHFACYEKNNFLYMINFFAFLIKSQMQARYQQLRNSLLIRIRKRQNSQATQTSCANACRCSIVSCCCAAICWYCWSCRLNSSYCRCWAAMYSSGVMTEPACTYGVVTAAVVTGDWLDMTINCSEDSVGCGGVVAVSGNNSSRQYATFQFAISTHNALVLRCGGP